SSGSPWAGTWSPTAAYLSLVRVLDQHGAGHRSDSSGIRCQPTRDLVDAGPEIAHLAPALPVGADVDHRRARLDHLLADQVGPSSRRHEDIGSSSVTREVSGARVTQGHGCVAFEHEERRRFAGEVAATD